MAGNGSPSVVKSIALNYLFCCIWMTKKTFINTINWRGVHWQLGEKASV